MRVRALKESDIPVLKAMEHGLPYPDPAGDLEAILVVVDDDDRPVMAAAAKRLVEGYLWCGEIERPLVKLAAMRALEAEMDRILVRKGYNTVEAFLPPSVAQKFGRRLEKTFGYRRNWESWNRRLRQ